MFGGGGRENQTLGRLTQMTMPVSLHFDPTTAIGVGTDEDVPRRDERVLQWGQQETRDFIGIRAQLETDFTLSKRNKNLWEVVSTKMKERGYRRTPDQCKCKWKNLVNRYKGKETSDMDNGRQCPFFEELHAVFTQSANDMQRLHLHLESEAGPAKKKVKRISKDHYSEDLSVDDDEDESEEPGRSSNPPKSKGGREKQSSTSALENQSSRQPSANNTTSGLTSMQEMLREFIQQQQRIDTEWRESMEKRAYERLLLEKEWQQSMEKLERERITIEQTWREKEEQRRTRDESRAENRDALLTSLLDKLIHEYHH